MLTFLVSCGVITYLIRAFLYYCADVDIKEHAMHKWDGYYSEALHRYVMYR